MNCTRASSSVSLGVSGSRPESAGREAEMTRPVQRIVVLGGPGDGSSVADAVHCAAAAGRPVILAGFLNATLPRGALLQGVPILGPLEEWCELDDNIHFVPAIQKVKDMPRRVQRLEDLDIPEERWGIVIHPAAVVSSDVEIGPGSFVLSCATIQPAARIGRFAGVRAGAMLGHHCVI